MALLRQEHLEKLAKRRLWHALKAEILNLLGATATEDMAANVIGISPRWLVSLSNIGVLRIEARSPHMGPRETDEILKKLIALSSRYPSILQAPRLSQEPALFRANLTAPAARYIRRN